MAKIIIIGGGVSGLAAGIHAQLCGHDAVIYERHSRAGGNLTGWDRCGYHIDNCIHWLTGTNKLSSMYKTWEKLGVLGNVGVYQPKTLYTFDKNGRSISLSRNIEKLKNDMLAVSPEDEAEIMSFIRAVKAFMCIEGIAGDACDKKSTAIERAMSFPRIAKYYGLSAGELADRFRSPIIRGFIESLLGREFGAIAVIMVFATFCGQNGGIPVGSSCAAAERMTGRFVQLGGTLKLRLGVQKININGSSAESVLLDNGTTDTADYFLIATDPAAAFGSVLGSEYMPRKLKKQYADSKLMRFSSWHCAFACDIPLLPFSGDIIFEVPDEYRSTVHSEYLILREFSHEKDFAPEGKSIIQSMVFVGEKDARAFISLAADKTEYEKKECELAEAVKRIIIDKFDILRGKLKCIDVWTPATYKRYVGSEIGSYMSFVFSSRYIPTSISPKIKGLANVLLATQWLRLPGGLPNAANAGIDAVNAIGEKVREADTVFSKKRTQTS